MIRLGTLPETARIKAANTRFIEKREKSCQIACALTAGGLRRAKILSTASIEHNAIR